MASVSLRCWASIRSSELDDIEAALHAVGGSSRGARSAVRQVSHAYVVLLCSQFQGFCRDLHSESIDCLVEGVAPAMLSTILRADLLLSRKLDRENPTPGSIGADFNRLGLLFWNEVIRVDSRNRSRQQRLERMNRWRNAIAHQSFDPERLTPRVITFSRVRHWRRSCNGLAASFDRVMSRHLSSIVGALPW